ncbi:MAG: nuclear transport factor 2 family protein [Xanthomonadaceae bacterium]|nr:nuclear transport factor 2 family protein [Xanthomonadaceae bacterium]
MKLHTLSLSLILIAAPAWSHGKEKHDAAVVAGRDDSRAEQQIAPAAADAVAVVERFSAALAAGDVDKAAAELDPAVLILESGGVERSRDEYLLAGHARADAAFLKEAQVSPRRRTAQASGELAWVGSESAIHAKKGETVLAIDSTETMVLRKTAQGWKIVHIHWSSRRAGGDH